MPSHRYRGFVRPVIGLAVLAALCGFAVARMDPGRVVDAIVSARLSLLVLSILLTGGVLLLRSERWYRMLPAPRVPRRPLFLYLFVSFGLTMVTPVGAPEALRAYVLKRDHDVPLPVGVASLLLEKVFEGAGLIPLVAPLPLLLDLPQAVDVLVLALSLGGTMLVGTLVWLTRQSVHRPWGIFRTRTWRRLEPGLRCLRDPGTFWRLLLLSVGAHALDCVCSWLLLESVGIDAPLATSPLMVLMLSFAVVIPLVPGHVGMLEMGAVTALRMVGVDFEPALAFALVCHAGQMVFVLGALPGIGLVREARAQERVLGRFEDAVLQPSVSQASVSSVSPVPTRPNGNA